MNISMEKFLDQCYALGIGELFEGVTQNKLVHGGLYSENGIPTLEYDLGTDEWYKWGSEDEADGEDEIKEHEITINFYDNGYLSFSSPEDGEEFASYYVYNALELKQLISVLESKISQKALKGFNNLVIHKADDIIEACYVTVYDAEKEQHNLCKLIDIRESLSEEHYLLFLKEMLNYEYNHDDSFLINKAGGDWANFVQKSELPIVNKYNQITSSYYCQGKIYNTSEHYLSYNYVKDLPCLVFKISDNFSYQYFYDYLKYSSDGSKFLDDFSKSLLSGKKNTLDGLSIKAPKNLLQQILYSNSLRTTKAVHDQSIQEIDSIRSEHIEDIKSVLINRKKSIEHFVQNKKNTKILDEILYPLPHLLDRTNKSYIRAASDFDRQNNGGRLFNYILKSLVIYPLLEMQYLQFHTKNNTIQEIITTLNESKPISDGTWLSFFQKISKEVGKSKDIELSFFGKLLKSFEKLYHDMQPLISKRNDWAHYREHPEVYQRELDTLLPKLIAELRKCFEGILIIYVEGVEYVSETKKVIKAKKMMGYESDVETIKLTSELEGKYFINNRLYAYSDKYNFTIPLNPYISIEKESVVQFKMGIYDNFKDGSIIYSY